MTNPDTGSTYNVEEHGVPDTGADLGAVVPELLPRVGGNVVGVEAAEGGVRAGPLTLSTGRQE